MKFFVRPVALEHPAVVLLYGVLFLAPCEHAPLTKISVRIVDRIKLLDGSIGSPFIS